MFEYEKDFVCRAGDGLRRAAAEAGRGLDGKPEVSGTELALVFNLSDEGATLDVPDQGRKESRLRSHGRGRRH